jgi:hypothetical protein
MKTSEALWYLTRGSYTMLDALVCAISVMSMEGDGIEDCDVTISSDH